MDAVCRQPGAVLREQGHLDQAASCYRRALALKPDHAEVHYNLGAALKDQGKLDEAAASYRRAIALKPDYAYANYNLGAALKDQGHSGRGGGVLPAGRRAGGRTSANAHYNLGIVLDTDQGRASTRRSRRSTGPWPSSQTFWRPPATGCSASTTRSGSRPTSRLLAEHRDWDQRHGGAAGACGSVIYPNARDPDRRLRIGYVSGDFNSHPVGFFLIKALAARRPRRGRGGLLFLGGEAADEMTARLRASADHWRSLVGISDDDAAAMIRQDGIDILVDLSGHTARNRLPLFARRPAPVQATWLGYPGTNRPFRHRLFDHRRRRGS